MGSKEEVTETRKNCPKRVYNLSGSCIWQERRDPLRNCGEGILHAIRTLGDFFPVDVITVYSHGHACQAESWVQFLKWIREEVLVKGMWGLACLESIQIL